MATLTPTSPRRTSAYCLLVMFAALFGDRVRGQEVVLTPAFTTPVAGQSLPYTVANHGTDTVSVCLTNGWSALGVQGTSAFTVERRFSGRWHKVLGKDLRGQLAQPIPAGATAPLSMAGLGEPGTYRLEVNYVHGLVPSCWTPRVGKIHVLHSEPFDLEDTASAPKTTPEAEPELKPR